MRKSETIQRIEKKYLLQAQEYTTFLNRIRPYIEEDEYANSTIYNLYLDSDDYHLITTSMQKPIYKEKLRLRSYQPLDFHDEGTVFLEIKKKWKQTVYKRRIELPLSQALALIAGQKIPDTQIGKELAYALQFHQVTPKVYVAYDRISFRGRKEESLRITFDSHIRGRFHELSLQDTTGTKELLSQQEVLMEIKAVGSYPFWLVQALSDGKLYPTSFSKVARILKEEVQKGGDGVCLPVYSQMSVRD